MKCRKLFLYFVSCLLFVSVFTSFTSSPNTSAVSDITYHRDSTNNENFIVCSSISDPPVSDCTSLKYVYVTSNIFRGNLSATASPFFFYFRGPHGSGTNTRLYYSTLPQLLDFSSLSVGLLQLSIPAIQTTGLPSGWYFDFTFSSSNPLVSGSLSITENGTYDVSSYSQAVVDVPAEVIYGDYHDDLISINNSIIMCAGVCLVLYFFYCIYRMIIKNTGGGR